MGMNDAVERFTAVINPPQAAILAVGTTKKVAVPAEGEDDTTSVEWDDQIVVTASFDHKVVDGQSAPSGCRRSRRWSRTHWSCCCEAAVEGRERAI